jgi:3-oxoacyl-[acyl-carrier protein] reductase
MARSGRTILVTGATGGMGRPLCAALAAAGDNLVLCARSVQPLETLARDLTRDHGGSHLALAVDMGDLASVARFGELLLAQTIRLDGAVLMPPQPARSNDPLPDPSAWTALFHGSFIGPLELLKQAIGAMDPDPAAGRRAKVVIVSGITSAQVLGHYAMGNVLRTAWLGQAKTLAFALGPRGIHINTVSFGGTLTPYYVGLIEGRAEANGVTLAEQIAAETDNVPLHKYGTSEEAAATIQMLLSPVSDHMTGINLLQDGGFTRAY